MAGDNMFQTYESSEAIRNNLPQRYPFLFIDKVKSVNHGKSIAVVKNVTYEDSYGPLNAQHFPPEFVLEIFGQAAILLFYSDGSRSPDNVTTFLVGIDTFNVYGDIRQGDSIDAEVKFEKLISNAAIISGRAVVDGVPLADARLTAAFIMKNNRKMQH